MSGQLNIGMRVELTGKGVQGTVAFTGKTQFAPGDWIGIILDEAKGKHNGTLKGVEYFKCEENFGLFVRESQVVRLDENGKPIETSQHPPSKIARSRQSISRMSLASSRQSLTGSRQSLSGSRQSLSGSRSHLASPSTEKANEGSEQTSQIPKRASFVETGFVETLKPQFTPGQAISNTPVSLMDEKINNLQLQTEIENRNQQMRDMAEKIEALKIKRQEDKEKLKDYDKLKIQLEQLLEFKAKIMSNQASLQRELQKAKQEAKEAIEARETHAEEVADLAEAVEMATLDKEMAEEKAETLQLELEVCREKLEEVTLDLEILKTEMQEKVGNVTMPASAEGQLSAYEIKQLQQQNARLRETLIKLRDLSAHEKHEYQKLLKDIDHKKSEISELGKTKEKLSVRVEEMEQQIADLQEQVDAALGAEEMVVILGEQKLTLEEKVTQLQEEVAELEALQDMNDQLVESNAELEADLREELDMAQAAIREAQRDRDAALETIADREQTIGKFRNLVQQLQDQSLELQRRLEQETSKPISALPDIMDFKKMFTETKAHIKAIDLELRRVDIQQLQQHIKYLMSFMPDSFKSRGGDYDAIMVLLLVPRMIAKTEILLSQIKDKFATVDKVDKKQILKDHSVEQFAFRCRISFHIFALQTILHQYYHILNTCKPEVLMKIGTYFSEMAAQEKIIDGFVELIKRDQLDENVQIEALEKSVSYFNTIFPMLLGPEFKLNQMQFISDYVKSIISATECFVVEALAMRCLVEGANVGDIGLLAQHLITTSEQLHQQLKLVKRRLPLDTNGTNLGLSKDVTDNLHQCFQHAGRIMKTLCEIVKSSIQFISSCGDLERGIPQEKIKDIAVAASDRIYEQDDLGPVQSIKNSITIILDQTTSLAQYLLDNEYEIALANKTEEKCSPPILIRSETVKKELEQTKTLSSKLENKESDIKELRKLLKEKQEQLSEMTIRKELAEKKLGNVNKDYELTIEKLQRKLEESQNNFRKKEKEFEETLDHLQTDIDSLENEKGEMKEKLKLLSKKAALEATLSKSMTGSQLPSLQSVGPSLPAVVKDSPLLLQEIDNLRKLFHKERNERIKLQNKKLEQELDSLSPLPVFYNRQDDDLKDLFREGAALKKEVLMTLAKPIFPAIYKITPKNRPAAWQKHLIEENNKILTLQRRVKQFQSKVAEEVVKRKFGGKIQTNFAVFPTKEMTMALKEVKTINIGFVKIPKKKILSNEMPKITNLEVDLQDLQNILKSFIMEN